MNRRTHTDAGDKRIQSLAFVIAAAAAVLLCIVFSQSIFTKADTSAQIDLQSRINPNTASPASLTRLPGIGSSRANAIVAYRENSRKSEPDIAAFQEPNDLQNVKGIGPKTVQNIKQWLRFE
ncbi:ComEA family DNA-binding protein [Planctomycetota bacterium]